MTLNIRKCFCMRPSRSNNLFEFEYTLCNEVISDVNEITDLGVTFIKCLNFSKHYEKVTRNTMTTLGFVFRIAKHFMNRDSLRLLYSSLVRPHLEYASVIWNPRHRVYVNLIESVQHKFMKSAAWVLGNPMAFSDHDYDHD